MHIAHLGVTQAPYKVVVGGLPVILAPNTRSPAINPANRADAEAQVAAHAAIGDLVLAYDSIVVFDSAVSAGGGTSETLTVTGLLATDTILSVAMKVKGGTATGIINGFGTPAANALPVTYSVDPGSGLKARVTVLR